METVVFDSLRKVYNEEIVAVNDLTLSVEEGEIFGFLGPNGAGKSTTINILLDFIRPTSGSVSVFGMDAQNQSAKIRERVGVLPEGYDVYPQLTGREHLAMAVATKNADDDPDELLATVGLEEDGEKPAGEYSKGMRQRLALGFALVGDPDLLILDEPSSGLDPNGIQLMESLVQERAAAGTTVFFSSHHLPQVQSVCDRVGVMKDGQLVATNTVEKISSEWAETQQIRLECASQPPVKTVEQIDGVADVTYEGGTLVVNCSDPARKIDIAVTVDKHVEVENVFAPEVSLEDTFSDLISAEEIDSNTGSKEVEIEA